MDYEDRLSIATPEGVTIDLVLAGVGSRFAAAIIDLGIQVLLVAAIFALAGNLADEGGLAAALAVLGSFLVFMGYDVLFETLASGRTPGKRWTGLRVVRSDGGPVGFVTSSVRNLCRIVDILPGAYFVGMVFVLASKHNQRLGDLAAGTLVVRERLGGRSRRRRSRRAAVIAPLPVPEDAVRWDVSAVTEDELATVRRFLDRRDSLVPEARSRLAIDLAGRLGPKVVGPVPGLPPEQFLVGLAAAKASRR